jgi:hypothetical protein
MQKDESVSMITGYVHWFRAANFFSLGEIEMTGLGNRREIYLLGENGDGKSLILMSIVLALKGSFVKHYTDYKETGKVLDLLKENRKLSLFGKDSENRTYEQKGEAFEIGEQVIFLENLLAYGVHRSRNDSEKTSKYGFMTLFDADQYLISPERWLMSLYTKELEKEMGKKAPGTPPWCSSTNSFTSDSPIPVPSHSPVFESSTW